jgi:hypothetical protein
MFFVIVCVEQDFTWSVRLRGQNILGWLTYIYFL